MTFEAVIGLEIHTQLATSTKAWCNCEVNTRYRENELVCEVCSAQPGTLPVVNKKAIELATRLALATNCKINQVSSYDRKNYFYPDLPKGYQITQFYTPIAENGFLEIEVAGKAKKLNIERIQLEEDTGKSTHEKEHSLINLNRAGTPLVEIVTGPDFRTAEEATTFLKDLHLILVYLGVSKGNLQDGNFRCDVNLSLRKEGEAYGTRTEVKNLNSFKSVEKSIAYEKKRQAEILNKGEKVLQETMLFDISTGKTRSLRVKSDADDYRYFPEPDLMPLIVSDEEIEKSKESLPELPNEKAKRFEEEFKIPKYDANLLTRDKDLADYFEKACELSNGKYKLVSNWVMGEMLRLVNEANAEISDLKLTPKRLVGLLDFIDRGAISGSVAKDVLLKMFDENKDAKEIIENENLSQNNDEDELKSLAKEVLDAHPKEVEAFKGGKDRMMGFFVGQVMKKTAGKANPKIVSDLMKELLK